MITQDQREKYQGKSFPKCFKCGKETLCYKHHISYNPEVIVDCCISCHRKIHSRIRKNNECGLSIDAVKKLSKTSHHKRVMYVFQFNTKVGKNLQLMERLEYNKNTGNISYITTFEGHYGIKKGYRALPKLIID